MEDKFQNFCDEVCSALKHATPEERKAVAQELRDHMDDHAAALLEIGYDEAEARDRAVRAMGDAGEIGKELNRQYPLLWLILSRVPVFLIILLLIQLLMLPMGLYHLWHNVRSRTAPLQSNFSSAGDTVTPVDYRFDAPGNDVLYIYALDILDGDDESKRNGISSDYFVRISYCNYDRNPFGNASQLFLQRLRVSNASGEDESHGGGGGNGGAYHNTAYIPVSKGEEWLYLDYSGFGFELHEALPLHWEGIE